MLQQHQPLDRRIGLEDLGRLLGEREARHDVGHEPHAAAVELGAALGRVGLVGEAQHRRRMGVVDEFVRQEGVQQRLDRRVGRPGIEQIGALHAHHVLVGQRRARRNLRSGASRTAGSPAGSIAAMSQPLPLTHSTSASSPSRSRDDGLDRGVAAAVQHEPRLAAQQARGIDAQGEIAPDTLLGVALDHPLGVASDHRLCIFEPLSRDRPR